MKPKFTPKFNFLFKKLLLIGLFFFIGIIYIVHGKTHLWYENVTGIENINFVHAIRGSNSSNVVNSNISGLKTNSKVSRFIKNSEILPVPDPSILAGSWGIWYQIPGGINLDNSPANWPSKAQEIINDLPTMGHVILNFTQSAHGYYFLLRNNPYVDIANDIDSKMVPSAAKDQVILDVIKKFKDAGKRVILYVATDGPSATSGTPDNASFLASWEAYYKNSPLFSGTNTQKEGQAWRLLCKGFFERFRDAGVDGYWLDHIGGLPGGLANYVAMIRQVDPKAILATNSTIDNGSPDFYSYFKDANGNYLYVDTDNTSEQVGVNGTGDDPNRDYQIKAFNATDPYMDFTGGHITPLALGAPPNSWAYEEFTITEMVNSPYDSYDGSKQTLRHGFFPMRKEWTAAASDLVFTDVEQAYRFVRRITDAGASMTFATNMVGGTTSKASTAGTMSLDENVILKGVDSRMSQSPKPNYVPYSRPTGAYLVENAAPVLPIISTLFIQEDIVGYCGIEGSIENNYSGYTGTGFSNTTDVLGSGINWEINGSAGEYILVWRYANGDAVDRRSRLIINGSIVLENLSFPSTGSASTWNSTSITLNLSAGVKSIRLEATVEQGLANIDYIKITGPDISRSNCLSPNLKVLSVKENKLSISLFPNPVLDSFQIQGIEVGSVYIYSISGQLIKTFHKSQSSYSIDDLLSGVYFVRISNTTGSIVHKLIKS